MKGFPEGFLHRGGRRWLFATDIKKLYQSDKIFLTSGEALDLFTGMVAMGRSCIIE